MFEISKNWKFCSANTASEHFICLSKDCQTLNVYVVIKWVKGIYTRLTHSDHIHVYPFYTVTIF